MLKILLVASLLIFKNLYANKGALIESLCHFDKADIAKHLSKSLSEKISSEKIKNILSEFQKSDGPCLKIKHIENEKYLLITKKSKRPTSLYFNEEEKLTGLWFDHSQLTQDSFESINSDLKKNQTKDETYSFILLKNNKEIIWDFNSSLKMPLGSTFKVWILNEIRKDLEQKKYNFEKVLKLTKQNMSLKSGLLQDFPVGTSFTIESLASLMISESDNTATDHLIDFIGRDRLTKSINGKDPFLKTSEMFKLKTKDSNLRKRYLKSPMKEKLLILKDLSKVSLPSYSDLVSEPVEIDLIEWHSDARRTCQVFFDVKDFVLMGINPGIAKNDDWKRVLYKGGSEAGVLNMSHLVKNSKGDWFCLFASWKSSKIVSNTELSNYVSRVLNLVEK